MNDMKIIASSAYVPDRVVTNQDLENLVDTSDEWIQKRTGIQERRIAVNQSATEMASQVAKELLADSKIDPDAVKLIICATMSADHSSPSTAAGVQAAIGATNAMCFDLAAACSGFVYSLSVASKILASHDQGYAIVIGVEKMSRIIDWQDRTTCVLFGDGAGGVLLEAGSDSFVLAEDLKADGSQGQAILAGGHNAPNPFNQLESASDFYMQMDGRAVYDFSTRTVPQQIADVLAGAGKAVDQIDYFVLHQANRRMLKVMARKLGISPDQLPVNLDKYGNTSAASVPILLNELVKEGKIGLDQDQTIVLSGFGGGLTWASMVIKI
ncbi:beta-ketoacyl-ACP synthase III [Aerococcus urinaehominis]|nr:beta-ketoacyl-ACP synthase III [Aerococcus urinaehominis]